VVLGNENGGSGKSLGTRPSLSHVTARAEVMNLVEALKLPLDARGQRRAAARAEWFAALEKPLEVHDLIGD
jgi:chromosome partitioning protein